MLMVLFTIAIGTLMVTTVQIMVIFMPIPLLEEPQLTRHVVPVEVELLPQLAVQPKRLQRHPLFQRNLQRRHQPCLALTPMKIGMM